MTVSPKNITTSPQTTMSLYSPFARMLGSLLIFLLCAIPAVLMAIRVNASTPNFPMIDQWDVTLFDVLDIRNPGQLLTIFTQFHNEHRIFFTRTLSRVISLFTSANFRVETLPVFILSSTCLWVVYRWLRHAFPPIASVLVVITAILIFSPRNTNTYISGFQTPFLFVLFFLMLALYQVTMRFIGWQPLILAAMFAVCATFSLSSGTTSWFILFLILIARGYRKPQYLIFWCAAATICLFLFFQDFPGSASRVSIIDNPVLAVKAFLIYLASPFFTQHPEWIDPAIIIAALGLLFLAGHIVWYWMREKKIAPLFFPFGLVIFSLVTAMTVVFGRLEFSIANPEQPLSSRYVIHAMWWVVALCAIGGSNLFSLVKSLAPSLLTRVFAIASMVFFTILTLFFMVSNAHDSQNPLYIASDVELCYTNYALFDTYDPNCMQASIMLAPTLWLPRLRLLAERDLAYFAQETITVPLNSVPPLLINVVNAEAGIYSAYENTDGRDIPALFMHPNSTIQYRVYVPPQRTATRFTADLYISNENLAANPEFPQDGAEFIVTLYDASNSQLARQAAIYDPTVDSGLKPMTIDLGAYAGMLITVELSTNARETTAYDWAQWVDGQFIFSR